MKKLIILTAIAIAVSSCYAKRHGLHSNVNAKFIKEHKREVSNR